MNISICGGTGGMGTLYARLLEKYGHTVHCFDRELHDFETVAQQSDVIVLSVPGSVVSNVVSKISKLSNSSEKLIISLSSVMSHDAEILSQVDLKYMCIHFLFGPDITHFEKHNVIMTPSDHDRAQELTSLLEKEKMNIVTMEPNEHDRVIGYTQALSQFMSIVFGDTLSESNFSFEDIVGAQTVSSRFTMEALKRISKQDASLWSSIQFNNPYFQDILKVCKKNIEKFSQFVDSKDEAGFKNEFTHIQNYVPKNISTYSNVSDIAHNVTDNESILALGPVGTYSHQAAKEYFKTDDITYMPSLSSIIKRLSTYPESRAVMPLENSIHGLVYETLYGIDQENLVIVDQYTLPIHHALVTMSDDTPYDDITDIYSHPQALGQCYDFISKNFPHAAIHITASTSAGIEKIKTESLSAAAAIGSEFAAHICGLKIREKDIQDNQKNETTFAIVESKERQGTEDDYLKDKKSPTTLLVISPQENTSGLLFSILEIFKKLDINIVNVASRPQKNTTGLYKFYVTLEILSDDERLQIIEEQLSSQSFSFKQLTS